MTKVKILNPNKKRVFSKLLKKIVIKILKKPLLKYRKIYNSQFNKTRRMINYKFQRAKKLSKNRILLKSLILTKNQFIKKLNKKIFPNKRKK